MSSAQRVGAIVLAVVILAVAFVLARPEDEDDQADAPAPAVETAPPGPEPTATTDTRPQQRVVLRDHEPAGGVMRVQAKKGDLVRLVVTSDTADQIHVHGYDIRRATSPRSPARFSFRADKGGAFTVESHAAEHRGRDPVVMRLVVAQP